MDRRRLLGWLALFVVAILIGVWEPPEPARGGRVDPRLVRVTVGVDGAVRIEAADGTDLVVGNLSSDALNSDATLERLHAQLRRLREVAPKEPSGYSLLTLDTHGSGAAPWRWIRWIMQVASAVDVRIDHVQLRTLASARAPVALRLKRDGSVAPATNLSCAVVVRLVRRQPSDGSSARTTIVVGLVEAGMSDWPRPVIAESMATIESGPAGLLGWLAQHSTDRSGCEGLVRVEIENQIPPSRIVEISIGEVIETMLVLRDFGLDVGWY